MSENKNYNTLILSSLKDFQSTFPEMTFGEILYSFLRQSLPDNCTCKSHLKEIRELTDESIYEGIEKTIKAEQEIWN